MTWFSIVKKVSRLKVSKFISDYLDSIKSGEVFTSHDIKNYTDEEVLSQQIGQILNNPLGRMTKWSTVGRYEKLSNDEIKTHRKNNKGLHPSIKYYRKVR